MSSDKYLYMKIYHALLDDIKNGVYKKGEQLPTEKELSKRFEVSRITSQKAMNKLVENKIVIRRPGMGSFVANQSEVQNTGLDDWMEMTENKETSAKENKPSKIIGLVLETIWSCFGIGIFDGVYEAAEKLGLSLIIKKSYGSQKKEMEVIDELIDMGAEGIIIIPAHGDYYNEEILKLIVKKFPIVFVDRYLNGIHVPYVGSDNQKASEQCVRYLVEKGHKKIALITAKGDEATSIEERNEGYVSGIINAGLRLYREYIYDEVKSMLPNQWPQTDIENALLGMQEFLELHREITAVVTTEYYIASFLKKAAEKISIRIPEDLSIICFDSPEQYLDDYEFTFIRQNEKQIGQEAFRLLYEYMQYGKCQDRILVEAELVEGRSTKEEA